MDKSLSFYRFSKVKTIAASNLRALLLQQQTEWLKALHRTDVRETQINTIRIFPAHFETGKFIYFNCYDKLSKTRIIFSYFETIV